jgi:NitT/TauT family transport system substrate-binding protein
MEKRIKIGLAIMLAIILIGLVIFTPLKSTGVFTLGDNNETIKVRMGSLPVVHALPVYLAIEKGYFKDAGINIELVKLEAPNQIIDGIMQGQLDFTSTSGAAGISAVADYKNPGKLKVYALSGGTIDNPNDAILIPSDSNITSIKELKGKKLGIIGGSLQWKLLSQYLLEQNELVADKDITIVELALSTHVTAIASKQVDALLTLEPSISTIIKSGVGKILVNGPFENTLSNPFYPGAGIVSTQFSEEHPNTTAKVIEIINRANKEIQSNPSAARQYLKGYTPLKDDLIAIVPLPLIKTCGEINSNDINGLQTFYDIFQKYNAIDGKLSAQKILYCEK